MKKTFYVILLLLIFPIVVNAKTVKCTTNTNFRIGEDPYEGISVSCTDGTDTLNCSGSDECVKNNNFKLQLFSVWGSNAKAENYHNMVDTDQVKAGETYALLFLLTYNFGTDDKLYVDGEDQSNFKMACEYGCTLSGAERSPKAGGTTAKTTKKTTTKPVVVNVYWLNFNLNGGTGEIKNQAVEEGKTGTMPDVTPTREGYKFVEWQLDGKKFDFNTKITKTIELKAKWEEDTTGKENFTFVKLYNLSAPYGGKELDTQIGVETTEPWDIKFFSVGVDWYRGKTKDKITEKVDKPYQHKAEKGYYYQAVITLTPGKGYTLNNTQIKLNGKIMKTTKDEEKVLFKWDVFGPVEDGKDLNPPVYIKDVNETICLDDYTTGFTAELIYDANRKDEVVVDGDDYVKLSDPEHFELLNYNIVKGSGHRNLIRSSWLNNDEDGTAILTYVGLKAKAAGTYTTEVYFYDIEGKKYSGTITVKRSFEKMEVIKLENHSNIQALLEFQGEVNKHWKLQVEDLTNKDNGKAIAANMDISSIGGLVAIYNINVTSEEGEKTAGSCKIMIKLTDEMKKYKNFSFVYVSDDIEDQPKVGDKVSVKVDGDYIVATLPHLSTWALVSNNDKEKSKPTDPEKTNNFKMLLPAIGGCLCIVGIIICIIAFKKSKSKKNNEVAEDKKEDE